MGTPVSALRGGVGSERWAQGVEVSLLVLSCPCPPGWHGVLCPLRSPEPTPLLPPFPEAMSLRVPGSLETRGFSVVPALWEEAVTGARVGRTAGSGRASGLSPLTHSAASVDFSIASPLGFLLPALPSPPFFFLWPPLPPTSSSSGDGGAWWGKESCIWYGVGGGPGRGQSPGHPSSRLWAGRSGLRPTWPVSPPRARLSMGLFCFTAYLSFHSPGQLSQEWGGDT